MSSAQNGHRFIGNPYRKTTGLTDTASKAILDKWQEGCACLDWQRRGICQFTCEDERPLSRLRVFEDVKMNASPEPLRIPKHHSQLVDSRDQLRCGDEQKFDGGFPWLVTATRGLDPPNRLMLNAILICSARNSHIFGRL